MNFAMTSHKDKISKMPLTSGVYLMKDTKGKVIYVGKAVSLRKRVQSYFRKNTGMLKTDVLVSNIHDIDFIETQSEAEALILEASLIKEHDPKFNVDLRDDKSYPLIVMTNEEFPRIFVDRPHDRKPGYKYYGPYVNAGLIREALVIIRKIFPFRTCEPFPAKECLDFHMGLCLAPCIGSITKQGYLKNVRNICLILEGKKDQLYKNLRADMEEFSREQKFEEAKRVRDQLRAIGALYSGTKDVNYYKEAEQLQRALNLPKLPERIETFDISNIMGNQAVGSMVSFFQGKPDKNNYRRFKIREVEGIDDFKMIAEVVRRRYTRLKNEKKPFPDLIVIDGGKGQLSAACEELKKLDVNIPIMSLAKREEEVFLPNKRAAIILRHDSLGLKLLQRVRDEAHRFALKYHHVLRTKGVFDRVSQKSKISHSFPVESSGSHS
jgi:excinuclease ABC subunit C